MTWAESIKMVERGQSPDGLPINPRRVKLRVPGFKVKGPVEPGWYSYRRPKQGLAGQFFWVTEWFRITNRGEGDEDQLRPDRG